MVVIALVSILLCTSVSEASWVSKKGKDTDLHQVVDKVLKDAKKYLSDQQLNVVPLPDFFHEAKDYFFDTKNCQFGQFSSVQLEALNSLDRSKAKDGGKVYFFNLTLGLNPLQVSCDYRLVPTSEDRTPNEGSLMFVSIKNFFLVVGKVETGDGYCQAELLSSKGIGVEDFPFKTDDVSSQELVQKYIADFMSPHLLNIINSALDGFSMSPSFRRKFEDIICDTISK